MSRTKKDRPYWVRVNDPREARRETHRHHKCGVKVDFISISGKKIDTNIPDYCTIGEKEKGLSSNENDLNPCYFQLTWQYPASRHSPKKLRRDEYWKPMRGAERKYLKNAVVDYNTFGEVDEDAFLREKTLNSAFSGGYWN